MYFNIDIELLNIQKYILLYFIIRNNYVIGDIQYYLVKLNFVLVGQWKFQPQAISMTVTYISTGFAVSN